MTMTRSPETEEPATRAKPTFDALVVDGEPRASPSNRTSAHGSCICQLLPFTSFAFVAVVVDSLHVVFGNCSPRVRCFARAIYNNNNTLPVRVRRQEHRGARPPRLPPVDASRRSRSSSSTASRLWPPACMHLARGTRRRTLAPCPPPRVGALRVARPACPEPRLSCTAVVRPTPMSCTGL